MNPFITGKLYRPRYNNVPLWASTEPTDGEKVCMLNPVDAVLCIVKLNNGYALLIVSGPSTGSPRVGYSTTVNMSEISQ